MRSLAAFCLLSLLIVTSARTTPRPSGRDFSTQVQIDMMWCAREHGITSEQLQDYKSNKSRPMNVKCFINCIFEKVGIMKHGVYQRDYILQRLSEEIGVVDARRVVDQCARDPTPHETGCEYAAKIHECGFEILQKLQ